MRNNGTTCAGVEAVIDTISILREGKSAQYRQLYRQLRSMILDRSLGPGMRLPSTRALASDLKIARNSVVTAYEQLETEGYIETSRGRLARVAELPSPSIQGSAPAHPSLEEHLSRRGHLLLDQKHRAAHARRLLFQPGMPDMDEFPFGQWRRLTARHLRSGREEMFGYHSFSGHPRLREAISAYVGTSRGVRCTPQQVLVTSGAQSALNLLAQVLVDPGDDVVLEEPGYTGAQGAFLAAGANLVPLTVDRRGWNLEGLRGLSPRLICLTPSCQFPLGHTMRMEQRLRVLELAHSCGAWILEDDFDSEYRFSTQPVPSMQGVDVNRRTIYMGTFSKTLFPSLRIGFLVFPGIVDERMSKACFLLGTMAPLFLQAALADFLETGAFARHLRRMKRIYGRRRASFLEEASQRLGPWLRAVDSGSGLQTIWKLIPDVEDTEVCRLAAKEALNPTPLSIHYYHGSPAQGLILGYAMMDQIEMERGLSRLRRVLEQCAPPQCGS